MELLWQVAWPYLVLFVAGTALSWPTELRQGRWWQIALSGIALYFLRSGLTARAAGLDLGDEFLKAWQHYVMASITLGVFWTPNFAYFGALIFCYIVDDADPDPIGYVDASLARKTFKNGDYKEALRLAARELERDPLDYECLLITARANRHLGNRLRASLPLRRIMRSKRSSAEQRNYARLLLENRENEVPQPANPVGLKISQWGPLWEEED